MEQIRVLMDKTPADEFFKRRLGKPADIEGVPAGKQCKALDLLCLALRVCAVQGLHVIHLPDLRRPAAHRARFWYIADAALC